MPPLVSEDVVQAPGPHGDMNYGGASEMAAAQKSLQSQAGGGQPPQQAQPAAPQAPQAPQPPVQPQAQQQPQPDQGQRLDMNQVFPPMPEMQPQYPWRGVIRAAAFHPQGGPALARLADAIQGQKGPLY